MGLKTIPHRSYSPYLSHGDFWLFGRLKEFLKGNGFQTEKDLFDKIQEFIYLFNKKTIKKVCNDRIKRLHRVIEIQGEYFFNAFCI